MRAKKRFQRLLRRLATGVRKKATTSTPSAVATCFDRSFYLTRYEDVARSGMDPLDHFLEFGWKECRDPAPWFSTCGYLNAYPDVAADGINPFLHYLRQGKEEGRSAIPEYDHHSESLDLMLRYPERPTDPASSRYDPRRLHIHWLIADFSPGSGGHKNIFRMIHQLETLGHVCKIWIIRLSVHRNLFHARADIALAYKPVKAQIGILTQGFEAAEGDALVATSWETTWPVSYATGFKQRFYFVQDYEPMFYSAGAQSLAAEASYSRDLACICAGPWLRQLMQTKFGRWARAYDFAFDPNFYRPAPNRGLGGIPRIAVYARQLTARRLVELVFCALDELQRRKVTFHADLFGSHEMFQHLRFAFTNHGILDEEGLARLYNECNLGICMSATNHSIIAKEMMACGLPLVELDGDNTRSVFPEEVVAFTKPDPSVLADQVGRLLADPGSARDQAERALAWVGQFSWEKSAGEVEQAIVTRLRESGRWTEREVSAKPATQGMDAPTADGPTGRSLGPIVFAGQPEYYRSAYYDAVSTGRHFEFPINSANPVDRLQHLPEFVERCGARTCILFRPEWLAESNGAAEQMRMRGVCVVGVSSEPVPTGDGKAHPDQLLRLEFLKRALELRLDLLVHFDPTSLGVLREIGFDRLIAHPLPVSSSLFQPRDETMAFDACFLGRSTPHREQMLAALKRESKVIHIAHGLVDEQASKLMGRSRAVINLHCDTYPNFENRAIQALRCGRPLISERLNGPWLKPGQDYYLAETPEDLLRLVSELSAGTAAPYRSPDLGEFTIKVFLERIETALVQG